MAGYWPIPRNGAVMAQAIVALEDLGGRYYNVGRPASFSCQYVFALPLACTEDESGLF